jgi:hypothetical protein
MELCFFLAAKKGLLTFCGHDEGTKGEFCLSFNAPAIFELPHMTEGAGRKRAKE